MNSLKKMLLVLFKPRKAFSDLENKTFMLPMLIIVITTLLFSVINNPKMMNSDMQTSIKEMKKTGASAKDIAETQKIMKETLNGTPAIYSIIPTIFSAFGVLFSVFITALFFYLGTLMMKSKKSLPMAISLVALAWTPLVIRTLLQTGSSVLSSSYISDVGLTKLFGLDPSSLLSGNVFSAFSYAVLQRIDLFAVGFLVLLTIGLIVVFSLSVKKATALVSAYFIASILIILIPVLASSILLNSSSMVISGPEANVQIEKAK